MSWSISFIGQTGKVAAALNEYSNKLDGVSKQEYDSSLPYLVGLVQQNTEATYDPVVKIEANGSGYWHDAKHMQNTVRVTLERIYGIIV